MASRIPRDRNVRLRYRRIKAFKCLCTPCSRNLYLLHVLKLLLGTCRSVGPRPAPRSLSVTGLETFRSTGPKAGPRSHLLRVLKLPLGTFRSTGPRPALRSLSVTGLETAVVHLSFHWAQGIYICCRSWNCCWALVAPLGPRPGPRNLNLLYKFWNCRWTLFVPLDTDTSSFPGFGTAARTLWFHTASLALLRNRFETAVGLLWSQTNPACPTLQRVFALQLATIGSTGHTCPSISSLRSVNCSLPPLVLQTPACQAL